MDTEQVTSGSCEGYSAVDLDRGFLLGRSLSAPSLELHGAPQMSRSRIVLEYTEASTPTMASWNNSSSVLSPSLALQCCSNLNFTPQHNLNFPVDGKSSTPCDGGQLKKSALASSLDLSGVDPASSYFSWEVSLIGDGTDSPRYCRESGLLDGTAWSPKYRAVPASPAEGSSLILSGTPSQANVSGEHQRPWREAVLLGSSQAPLVVVSAPYPEDQWQERTSILLPCAEKVDLGLSN